MVVMETERLIIRNFKADDWSDLLEYLSDEIVHTYEPSNVCSEEDCKRIAISRSQGNNFLAVCLKQTGKMIGHIYFAKKEPLEFGAWELGYIFNPLFYGNGYATEACHRIIQYGFVELSAHRIAALCNPENEKSWKLLERLHMRREGHFLQDAYFRRNSDGQPIWFDTYQYAILKDEWLEITK